MRLRRAEKKILHNVVLYSASQKASAAERCELAAAALHDDDAEIAGSSQSFHISSVPTATGEEEFVRVNDGVQVYGTEAERAAGDVKFFESIRHGDYRTVHCESSDYKPDDELSSTEPLVSKLASDLTSLDTVTSRESGGIVSDCAMSTAETDDASLGVGTSGADVDGL